MTVSTSKYRRKVMNEEVGDQSGGVAESIMKRTGHIVSGRFLVSDDASMIRSRMRRFLAGEHDAIVFVGGTGVSHDDVTIETVRPFLSKELDGFGEIFRAESYRRIGPPAFLSRATAGVVKGRLVVSLPGSPDAVKTALTMFVGQFPEIIQGSRS